MFRWSSYSESNNCLGEINAPGIFDTNRPISRVVIGQEVDYRSRLIYVRYCFTNTTLCL